MQNPRPENRGVRHVGPSAEESLELAWKTYRRSERFVCPLELRAYQPAESISRCTRKFQNCQSVRSVNYFAADDRAARNKTSAENNKNPSPGSVSMSGLFSKTNQEVNADPAIMRRMAT